MNESNLDVHQEYLTGRIDEIKHRLAILDEKLSGTKFSETGEIIGEPSESEYYSSARKSTDLFNRYIYETEIKQFLDDKKEIEAKRHTARENLKKATACLNDEKGYLALIDQELKKLDIQALTANDEELSRLKGPLDEQRAEKSKTLRNINEFILEIQTLNEEINAYNREEALNKEILSNLRKELSTIKNRKETEYINYEQYDKDKREFEDLSKVLPGLELFLKHYMESNMEKTTREFKEKYNDTTAPDPEKGPDPGKGPDPKRTSAPAQWQLDGFKMDFLEKFGYLPGEKEYQMNPNYKIGVPLVADEESLHYRDDGVNKKKRLFSKENLGRVVKKIKDPIKNIYEKLGNKIRFIRDKYDPLKNLDTKMAVK